MKTSIQNLCALALVFGLVSCKKNEKKDDNTADTESYVLIEKATTLNGIDGNCIAPPDWFNGSIPKPEPEKFPASSPDLSNCDFHLISWQYFLWLTEVVDGKLRFESYFTNKAIHPESKNDQYHILDIVEQAQSKGMLVDQNNRAVYSSILINDVFRNWVIENKLYDPEVFKNFDPNENFPVGSVSLKTSWKIVQPNENTSQLFTTKRDIELLGLVNGVPRIDKDNPKVQKGVEVALIGLHIAVVVEGHPEFIWASFEYDDNAPNFKKSNQKLDSIVSDRSWLLYKANTKAEKTNVNNATDLAFKGIVKEQMLTPVTEVARQYINGGGDSTNQRNIKHLNTNVKEQLEKNHSIWRNYFEVGAVWFNTSKGTLKPDWSPNIDSTMVTGSTKLSNSTIETFTQRFVNENQCFSCHNTTADFDIKPLSGKNVNLSHILKKNYQEGRELPISN